MIRAIRYKLRMIRYYSAPRRRTLLTRLVDVGLVAAIVLAFPATFMGNAQFRIESVLIERDGHLSRTTNDTVIATLLDPDAPPTQRTDVPFGEFHLKLTESRTGWPAASSVTQSRVVLDLNRYDQAGVQRDTRLDPDDPLRLAILDGLHRSRNSEIGHRTAMPEEAMQVAAAYDALVNRWGAGDGTRELRVLAWTINTLVWWAILSVALPALAAMLWVVVLIIQFTQSDLARQRDAQGLCTRCGYDLFGLDFNARCPECGTIIE